MGPMVYTDYASISQKHFYVLVYSAVHWLAMSNSCVNPIIYGFLHDSFRVRQHPISLTYLLTYFYS